VLSKEDGILLMLKVCQYGYQISSKFCAESKYAIKSTSWSSKKDLHKKSLQEVEHLNYTASRQIAKKCIESSKDFMLIYNIKNLSRPF